MSLQKSEESLKDGSVRSTPADESLDIAAHAGVKVVEATHKVYGKYSKWFLFLGLGLAAYIYSLDSTTTWSYLSIATSSFGDHTLISTIQVAQAIIGIYLYLSFYIIFSFFAWKVAVGKPIMAKIADVTSRGQSYAVVLLFYVVGYIIIASAQSVNAIAAGIVIYAIGYTGLQLLTQIIIADITTLKWRGLVSALISLPFVVNAFIGSNISSNVIFGAGWRWGYGMFAILVPVALSPLIITLVWAERKAKRLGLVPSASGDTSASYLQRILKVADQLDVIGLVLIGTSVALVLLPLTLYSTAKGGWHNASIIAMIVIGCILLPITVLWDVKFAHHPVIARRFVFNKSVVLAALIGAFDFISFYISYTYLFSFVLVVKPWSLVNATYFAQTQTVALTVFAILAGVGMRYYRRAKPLMIIGLCIRLLGCGLMIHSRGANASDAEIVWSQLLQGIGGGFAAITIQVSAQASVPHVDVAMVTAVVLLITEIGGSIGGAIAGAIWSNRMPGRLAHYLPGLSQEELDALFGSIVYAAGFPRGHPVREGVILAYDDVMKILTIAATAFAVVPLVFAFFMPDWYLGDQQNAVENSDLSGQKVQNYDAEKQ